MRQDWIEIDTQAEGKPLLSAEVDCFYDMIPSFVETCGSLPAECAHCFKGLVFLGGNQGRDIITQFEQLLGSLAFSLVGKCNAQVAVFYFTERAAVLTFQSVLDAALRGVDVQGRVQWRVSGRYWQDRYPQYFLSAKDLNPDYLHNLSLKDILGPSYEDFIEE